ncbi:MAG: alcohol dehydrogenase catalytic domain-containing protein [Verrucomicrobiales bacterium]|nr:alcohol dehydrogenase catalytic domain-containing protein [Verrucomicrobiales bacterium]
MRAIVYRGIDDLRLEELPVPTIRSDEILVRVAVCGVCPTDIKKIHHGTVPPPRVFGHETAGTIARIGARVRGFRVGDRVALHHHVPCLDCHACRHRAFAQCETYKRTGITAGFEPAGGGYAEYVRVMSFCLPGVVKVPARSTLDEAAMLEPVNTVLKGARRLGLLPGDTVLVAGQGPIGLLFTRLLKLEGARVIATDLLDSRLRLARRWGASVALRADLPDLVDQLRAASRSRRGLDAAVLAVPSNAALHQSMEALRGAGKLLLFAHTRRNDAEPIDLASICVDEKDLIGSYSADVTLQSEVASLVFRRRLDVRPLITHRFPLEQTAAAVALACKPTPDSLKVLVSPLGSPSHSITGRPPSRIHTKGVE